MSLSNVTIPINTSVIPVDTRTIPKVLFLPTVSTNAGRYLLVKDYYGTSSNSSITISTTGTDLLDDYNFKYTLSNAFGSVGIVSDGLRSWRLLDLYNGGLTPSSIPNTLRIQFAWYGSSYNSAGANVTTTVLNVFNSNQASFVAGNTLFGDPQPGVGKSFWIDYFPANSLTLTQRFYPGENNTVFFSALT